MNEETKSQISEALFGYGLRNDDGHNLSMDDTDEMAEYIMRQAAQAQAGGGEPDTKTGVKLCQQLLEALQPLRFDVWADHYEENRLWYEPCEEGAFLYYDEVVAILKTQSQEQQQ